MKTDATAVSGQGALPGREGFTLIEMSVVLVIIGLIVGGVLVGQELVSAAYVRAQISQIEKYNQAVNTFRGKYNELPGDMDGITCSQFGFASCNLRGTPGAGDGNGIIAGFDSGVNGAIQDGEPLMVWVDLNTAGMIEGGFHSALPAFPGNTFGGTITNTVPWWPTAKINSSNIVAVWSGGTSGVDGMNYFVIMAPASIYANTYIIYFANTTGDVYPGPTVLQAFNIDNKLDDGLPLSGRIVAVWPYAGIVRYSGNGSLTWGATPGSAGTCFDNSASSSGAPGVNNATYHYSIEINGGSSPNCRLSSRFE